VDQLVYMLILITWATCGCVCHSITDRRRDIREYDAKGYKKYLPI